MTARADVGRILLCAWLALSCVLHAQSATRSNPPLRAAVPLDPIAAILEAFESYELIGLGETHNEPLVHAFRLALIRHPKFPLLVNSIVLESGASNWQAEMDRYVSGELPSDDVPREIASSAADAFKTPMYADIPRTVRALNRNLPPERRIRILLGEAPDHRGRDEHVTSVIRREVLARQRRALIIYGNSHMLRRSAVSIEDIESERWLVNRLERSGAKVLSIWSVHGLDLARLQPDVASWPLPKLAMVKDTPLGAADFAFYHSFGAWRLKDGRPILVDGVPQHDPPRPGLSMEEQVDAVLYLAR